MPVPAKDDARPKRRWFLRAVAALAVVTAIASALVYWRLRAPLPDVDGTVAVDGLRGPVQVVRDADAVPHIRATNESDAHYALGYVHAQERLWQMEFQRRVAWGRLSEFAGAATVETDRLMRTVGLGRAAAASWPRLAPATRAVIESYVAGINAYLADHRGGSLPVEFALLGISPEPFRGEDVLAWHKTMAWLLSTNWRDELLQARIAARIGEEGAAQLMPASTPRGPIVLPPDAVPAPLPAEPLPAGPPVTVPILPPGRDAPGRQAPATPLSRGDDTLDALAARLGSLVNGPMAPPLTGASNNWVIAGSRTATGKPILANDPHLAGGTPGIWFLAHVTGGDLDVIGATIPGMPGVLIGHNAHIAWGITALLADVQDLYIERVNAADQAEFAGTWEPMAVVRETIKVRGADDVATRVRSTRHGPLVSDLDDRAVTALALRWTGHDADDQSAGAVLRINTATDWEAFTAGLTLAHAPVLNFVYADTKGNIGYIGPGAYPGRTNTDGRRPVPGWNGEHEWRGYIHHTEWPRSFNPARGYLVSANNQVVPDGHRFTLGTSWEAPYRAARISDLIDATTRITVDDVIRMQRDVKTAQAAMVVPFLLKARPLDSRSREAMERLRDWDGTMAGDSAAAALFDAWYEATVRGMFEDDLGPGLFADYWAVRNISAKALHIVIEQGESTWCDDVRTTEPETCATLTGHTLVRALDAMADRQGTGNLEKWRWDRVNAAVFPHPVFDQVRLLKRLFSRAAPAGGNSFTINPVMFIGNDVYSSSYRQIVDLAAMDASLFVIPVGQSGHVWSPQYDRLLAKWSKAEYIPMRFSTEAVDNARLSQLTLAPR